MAYTSIRDYAIIGNLRSAALVSKMGSIDWAPAPHIDSPSVFGAILDDTIGGKWSITPSDGYTSTQAYLPRTNVVVTTFKTREYEFDVTDFVPVDDDVPEKSLAKDTTFRIKRKVLCKKGVCKVHMVFDPRFDYARGETELSYIEHGILAQNENFHAILATKQILEKRRNGGGVEGDFELKEGESDSFVFRFGAQRIDSEKDSHNHLEEDLDRTCQYWLEWVHKCDTKKCTLPPLWGEDVIRSLLVLKILFFEPKGTVAAAATTSLPEEIGGVRNWDYRFTWLRDSAFTFQALFRAGHTQEAGTFVSFLLSLCESALTSPKGRVQIMYGLRGETDLPEEILPHLDGYRGSKPVRIGNGAYDQRQWDIFGSILDMLWELHLQQTGPIVTKENWMIFKTLADMTVQNWREPDEGLWEVRGGSTHFVYSKVMCWVALDRAIKLATVYDIDEPNFSLWEEEKEKMHDEILSRGYNTALGAFTQSYDSDNLDASVLLMPKVGFIEGDDPKMISTLRAIENTLICDGGLIKRYTSPDGLPGGEGAFLLATFWLIDAYELAGEHEKACKMFETILSYKNHLGLFSEEIDPDTKEFLGNFPQAYTHIGLINSAYLLSR